MAGAMPQPPAPVFSLTKARGPDLLPGAAPACPTRTLRGRGIGPWDISVWGMWRAQGLR